ncbi:MAG: toxic anion resistance protein [Bacillota bacterium]
MDNLIKENQTGVMDYDLEKQKDEITVRVQNSPMVNNIVKQVKINEPTSIITFGKEAAEEMSKFADSLLYSMEMTKIEDSGQLLMHLNNIMDKFDIKDFQPKKPGLFQRIFKMAKDSIEALFQKYHTMGDEIDKVFVSLKQYEAEINNANKQLETMYEKNLQYYEQLKQYIVAGDIVIDELKNKIIPNRQKKIELSGDKTDQLELNNLIQFLDMFEQRVYDLKLAENIAIQSMPQIKMMAYSNYNLVRKINSAFIVTIPVFKRCIIDSIMLKRQQIQAKAISALDEKTNEMLLRNAENNALQSKMAAQLASGSFVNIETLEKTWETIVKGIEETQKIQDENRQKRIEGSQRLEQMKKDFASRKIID